MSAMKERNINAWLLANMQQLFDTKIETRIANKTVLTYDIRYERFASSTYAFLYSTRFAIIIIFMQKYIKRFAGSRRMYHVEYARVVCK